MKFPQLPGRLNAPLPKAFVMIGSVVGLLVLLCCGVGTAGALLSPSGDPLPSRGSTTPAWVGTTTSAAPTATSAAPTLPPTPAASTSSGATVPQPQKTTGAPHPPPTTAAPQQGVHPGAFCSPHWAFGYTVGGVLMQCKPSATDTKFRWRQA